MIAEMRERRGPMPALLPPVGPGCFHASPGAQALGPQGRVRAGGAEGLLDDVVGRGFALLSPHDDPAARLEPGLAAWFRSIGGLSMHVDPATDAGGTYARWFAQHGAAVALQRPDFLTFGTAPSLDASATLVEALRQRLDSAWPQVRGVESIR
jgi:hypothetical protein